MKSGGKLYDEIMTEKLSLVEQFKKNVVSLLLDKLKQFEVTFERAAVIAKFVRTSFTSTLSEDKAREIINTEIKNYPEIGSAFISFIKQYEEQYKDVSIGAVRNLIKTKKTDQANTLLIKYLETKI